MGSITEEVQILPMEYEDLAEAGQVWLAAFDYLPIVEGWFPSRPKHREDPDLYHKEGLGMADMLRTYFTRGDTYVKAVINGKMAGFAKWTWEPTNFDTVAPVHDFSDLDPAVIPDYGFLVVFDQCFPKERKRYYGDRPRYGLDFLAISPDFQRRQIGAKLVKQGLEIAQKHGVMACVEASPKGHGLYKKMGFVDVGPCNMLYPSRGISVVLPEMKWEPKTGLEPVEKLEQS